MKANYLKKTASFLLLIFSVFAVFSSCVDSKEIPNSSFCNLVYPDGPEAFVRGGTCNIIWNANEGARIRIELYRYSEYHSTIAENIENSGRYTWMINDNLPEGEGYQLRISEETQDFLPVLSRNPFRILSMGDFSVLKDSRDGYEYRTVKIGEQWWMAENFRLEADEGVYCYDNDTAHCNRVGKLYTQEAARELAPPGWHLPTDEDWKILETYIGLDESLIDAYGDRGHSVGTILINSGLGFDALYGGYYNHCADGFGHNSYEAHFWTSEKNSDKNPLIRILGNSGSIMRMGTFCHQACSVRYIKD